MPQLPIEETSRDPGRESGSSLELCMQRTGFVVVKIGLLTRSLTTVYALVIALCCLMVGCLRTPTEVVSQSEKSPHDPLISSKSNSSFNYFQSKKKSSDDEAVARVKVNEPSSVDHRTHTKPVDDTGRVEIIADTSTRPHYSTEKIRKTVRHPSESWRSKSLIESAKKYPSKVSGSYYHRNSDRIKLATRYGAVAQSGSSGIRRVSNLKFDSLDHDESTKKKVEAKISTDQLRSREMNRYFNQLAQGKVSSSRIKQLENELHQDLEHAKPTFEGISDEMRRMQVSSILERAKRELKRENYEYAAFLAEQALESSYQGHIAFGPEEESPQMLLQRIKKNMPANFDSEVQKIEHTNPQIQTNGGQRVQNFQFSPSPVHPLKRRSVINPKQMRPQTRPSTDSIQELPMIVPRNMGTDRPQTAKPNVRQQVPASPGISLDSPAFEPYPAFEQKPAEQLEIPFPEKTTQQETPSRSQPALGLELEEVPDEPPAKVRLSGPEPVHQNPVEDAADLSKPGPQLMLPKLPVVPQDLTSQSFGHNQSRQATILNSSEQNQSKQSVPVKFQSKKTKTVQHVQAPGTENSSIAGESKSGLNESGLTLDEIEWELDEEKRPERESQWSGMSTLLLIVGGMIILLLSSIIVILLRRSNPSI